jgi:hypothetical protein
MASPPGRFLSPLLKASAIPAESESMRESLRATWPGVVGGLLALVWFVLGYQFAGYVTLLAAGFLYVVRKWRSPDLY